MKLQIGPIINQLMKAKRINLKALSEKTGISYSTLNHWKENRPPRKIEDVRKLAHFFKVEIHYLLFGCSEAVKSEFPQEIIEIPELNINTIPKDGLCISFKMNLLKTNLPL